LTEETIHLLLVASIAAIEPQWRAFPFASGQNSAESGNFEQDSYGILTFIMSSWKNQKARMRGSVDPIEPFLACEAVPRRARI
jgi:endo-1,4-beta-D-glucanase Y